MVDGMTHVVLMGGIQINTPPGTSDYFLPKVFEVRGNGSVDKGGVVNCKLRDRLNLMTVFFFEF